MRLVDPVHSRRAVHVLLRRRFVQRLRWVKLFVWYLYCRNVNVIDMHIVDEVFSSCQLATVV